jgi:signal transduction histidine kinase
MKGGETVIIDDVRADEPLAADYRAVIQSIGVPDQPPFNVIRSWMSVPLALEERVLGALTISWTAPAHFTPEHARLARAFANQATVAIENARLFDETKRRSRETDALLRADAELYRSLDVDEVLQAMCDVAVDVVGADKSLVSIWNEQRGQAFVRASRNFHSESLSLLQTSLNRAGHPGPAHDFDAQFYQAASIEALSPEMHAIQEREHIQATTDIPIRSPAGTVLGGFGVAYSEPHEFSDDEQRLLIALAERAAVAIQNAELYARAQQAASLEERQRLARELHDSVSQALYGIALGARTARELIDRDPARAAEPVDYVLSLAEAGLAEMRALIFELRPESLEQEGLVAALRKQVAATQARFGIAVEATLGDEPDAPIDVKEAVYRVGQEALHNVVKHAKASRAALTLSHDNGTIALEVRDDGAGFDPAGDFAGHLGLQSMRERAAKVRGILTISSAPGEGTVVRVSVPAPA